MDYRIPKGLSEMLAQSDAAALAVLTAHVRQQHEELRDESRRLDQERGEQPREESEEEREVCAFLQELEAIACNSIARNDGNVVHWIGTAAKQMNPLLS